MMHHSNIIVAVTNEDKKPYREINFNKVTDKCKTSEIILPFDTDYKILVKNENSTRIKLDIDIDGTIISGSGIVFDSHSNGYIERFIDVAKKLHFTRKTNEKVADPTNSENGFLTIKVVKEKQRPTLFGFPTGTFIWPKVDRWDDYYSDPYHPRWWYDHTPYPSVYCSTGGNDMIGSTGISRGLSASCSSAKDVPASLTASGSCLSGNTAPVSVNYCASVAAVNQPEVGATVEGEKSNQSFGNTSWYEDEEGSDFIFRFKMLGKGYSAEEEKEIAEYKRLKAKFGNI